MSLSPSCARRCADLSSTPAFSQALAAALLSGSAAVLLRRYDASFGLLNNFGPDLIVFNVFIVFASLVASFRTAHALVRYTEAACLLHKLQACWYDVASTLVAFCRFSDAPRYQVLQFQNTLLRLLSLLCALCLENLERKESEEAIGYRFEVMGWMDLNLDVQNNVMKSHCKVEHVFQAIHQLVVDAVKDGTLNAPPPILTRSFQELGHGMMIFHEAKKLSCVPLPYAYRFITRVVMCCELVIMPLVLAMTSKESAGAFVYTFGGTFMLWFLNMVADSLDNPFAKEAATLEPSVVQMELNLQLRELLEQGQQATPAMASDWQGRCSMGSTISMNILRQRYKATLSVGALSSFASRVLPKRVGRFASKDSCDRSAEPSDGVTVQRSSKSRLSYPSRYSGQSCRSDVSSSSDTAQSRTRMGTASLDMPSEETTCSNVIPSTSVEASATDANPGLPKPEAAHSLGGGVGVAAAASNPAAGSDDTARPQVTSGSARFPPVNAPPWAVGLSGDPQRHDCRL